jgi:undecaprenyl diphosphate synthase
VSDPAVRERILAAASRRFGGLDILINNAGIGTFGRFAESDAERLRRVMEVDFFAAVELTRANTTLTLNVALNYGGRQEIIDAIRRIVQDGLAPDQIDDAVLSRYLYTADQPDPDLIVRTSGEMRVSNFLIWQGAYAELYVTPTYWPDFDEHELQRALDHYASRERRFGLVAGQRSPHSTPSANTR